MQELTTVQFIHLLRQRNIEVRANDGRLQINAPAGAVDAQLREELTRRKAELLSTLQGAAAVQPQAAIAPTQRTGKIPQTDAQQGMWLIDYFDPGCVAYNIPVAYSADGPFDPAALQSAVDQLLLRHETLRTSFYEEDGDLFQRVETQVSAPVELTDITHVPPSGQDQVLEILMREQARRPFDLNHAPLVRFHLFRLAEQRHVVFFNIHHIIADRRSLAILREDLGALYLAAVQHQPPALPGLPIQFADYALWAAKRMTDGRMQKQAAYWQARLANLPEYLELAGDRPYPEKRTPWGETTPIVIDAALRDALKNIARQQGATMFITLLAAFAVLLYKKCGQPDFCIGSPSTLRTQVETESIIGLFVNMIVLRCDLSGQPTFRQVVQRVRATALEAYENSDLPFQELVRTLKVDMRSLRSPFFQVMFGFDSTEGERPSGLIQLDTKPGTARFDLTLQLTENADGISGSFEYCTDLFDEPGMAALSRRFVALLAELAAHPDRPVSELERSAIETAPAPPPASRPKQESASFFRRVIRPLAAWSSRR